MILIRVLGESIYIVKTDAEAVLVTSKDVGLEGNAEKSNYMIMSGDQNAGHNHNIKKGNYFFERVEQFRHLKTSLTNQNFFYEEIKSWCMQV